ncbi:MAG: hypothetical protein ACR2K2_06370 [Mycobacteriales bacterium]
MSNAAPRDHNGPRGTGLLRHDLSHEELEAAPVLASVDVLLIDDLTVDEDDRFAAALSS